MVIDGMQILNYSIVMIMPFIDKTSSQIWEKDRIKLNSLRERGFEIVIIWQSELDENTVDNLIKIITEKHNKINEQ